MVLNFGKYNRLNLFTYIIEWSFYTNLQIKRLVLPIFVLTILVFFATKLMTSSIDTLVQKLSLLSFIRTKHFYVY